jgi:hypothetical protein
MASRRAVLPPFPWAVLSFEFCVKAARLKTQNSKRKT